MSLSATIQWAGLALSVVMLIILIMSLSAVYGAEGRGDDLEFKLTSFNDISRSGNVEEVKYSDLISEAEELKSVSPYVKVIKDKLDAFKSWRTAGLIANIFFIIALIAAVGLLASRVITIFDNGDFLEIPDGLYSITQIGNKILPFAISGLMLIET